MLDFANLEYTQIELANKRVARKFFNNRHMLGCFAFTMMQAGVLPEPCIALGNLYLGYLIEVLIPIMPDIQGRMRLCGMIRVKFIVECVMAAIDRIFFSEVLLNKSVSDDRFYYKGKPFQLSDMLDLKPHLFLFADAAIHIVTSCVSQFVDPIRFDILMWMACIKCGHHIDAVPKALNPLQEDYTAAKKRGMEKAKREREAIELEKTGIPGEGIEVDPVRQCIDRHRDRAKKLFADNKRNINAIYGHPETATGIKEVPDVFYAMATERISSFKQEIHRVSKPVFATRSIGNKAYFDPNYYEFKGSFHGMCEQLERGIPGMVIGNESAKAKIRELLRMKISVIKLKWHPKSCKTPEAYKFDKIPVAPNWKPEIEEMPVLEVTPAKQQDDTVWRVLIKALKIDENYIIKKWMKSISNHYTTPMRVTIGKTYPGYPHLFQVANLEPVPGKILSAKNPTFVGLNVYNSIFNGCPNLGPDTRPRLQVDERNMHLHRIFEDGDPEWILYREFCEKENLPVAECMNNLSFAFMNQCEIASQTPYYQEMRNSKFESAFNAISESNPELSEELRRLAASDEMGITFGY